MSGYVPVRKTRQMLMLIDQYGADVCAKDLTRMLRYHPSGIATFNGLRRLEAAGLIRMVARRHKTKHYRTTTAGREMCAALLSEKDEQDGYRADRQAVPRGADVDSGAHASST